MSALLLLGHGSTVNAHSSAPTYQHAREIRRRRLFDQVHVAFWKEEPNFRQALRQIDSSRTYVVPNFISSGYFTEQIIPRELGLHGPVTRLHGREIIYCDPVGLHPAMTEALLRRAHQVVAQSAQPIPDPARTACLFICGHGTSLNDNSTRIIHHQADLIRRRRLYADCQPVLMEQSPFVRDWRRLTPCRHVIVVPFFISDGLHSFEDIPVLLGLPPGPPANPHREGDRRLWYATAIGTEDSIADVILAQVQQARQRHPETPPAPAQNSQTSASLPPAPAAPAPATASPAPASAEIPPSPRHNPITQNLAHLLATHPPPWKIGQVLIHPGFTLRHQQDAAAESTLAPLREPADLLPWILRNPSGQFRPLRASPDLQPGWLYHAPDLPALHLALDYLYPAELANWLLRQRGQLPVTPWPETAERQTGRFRIVRDLPEPQLLHLVDHICRRHCLKQRLWSPAAQPLHTPPGQIPLLCPEACNYLIAQAREKLKGPDPANE